MRVYVPALLLGRNHGLRLINMITQHYMTNTISIARIVLKLRLRYWRISRIRFHNNNRVRARTRAGVIILMCIIFITIA